MYETEKMRQILTSPKAKEFIQNISPRYGEAYVFLWLLQVIGLEFDVVCEYFEEYEKQVVPQTATWTLDYWEKQYGIITEPSWSASRRRENIINRMHGNGPMNPAKMVKIASVASGFPCRVDENTGKYEFTVCISATPDTVDEEAVRNAINHSKPAWLRCNIAFEQAVSSTQYIGGIIRRQQREITLQQL